VAGSIVIYGTYIGYLAAAITIFAFTSPRQAVLIVSMLGWLLLPVAAYPPEAVPSAGLTMEVIGIGLPSLLLINKALVVAVTVFVCLVVKAPALFSRIRVTLPDVALGLFCLSPLLATEAGKIPVEQGLVQVVYLVGVWGCTWMTGRLALADVEGRSGLVTAIMVSGLCLVIPAIVEGIRPAWLYTAIYGPHPFIFNGVSRYLGYRPLAFFEDGNQYGMWICMAALVCVHGVVIRRMRSTGHMAIAGLVTACAVASQSIGAILLLAGGCAYMLVSLRVRRIVMGAAVLLTVVGGAAYLSGKVPLRSWALETPSGQAINKVFYYTGRGSLGWRVQRDQKALGVIHQAPLTGHGAWDWWRPVGAHPWGLPQLIAGQFGLLAVAFAAFALLFAPLRDLWRGSISVLPVIVLLAMMDSLLNSSAYLPAIMVSAAIVVPIRKASAADSLLRRDPGDPLALDDQAKAHA
jgi:hypothetical protein